MERAEQPQRAGQFFRPKAPGTSVETLRSLAGIIRLNGPVPSKNLFDESIEEFKQISGLANVADE